MNEDQYPAFRNKQDAAAAAYESQGKGLRSLYAKTQREGRQPGPGDGEQQPVQAQSEPGGVEEDPDGRDRHEPGAKMDGGKPDASLLLMFGRALNAVAGVGTFGAKKYSRGGWVSVPSGRDRYTAALLRHMFQEEYNLLDSDSGLAHDVHAAWNALARVELRLREETNDGSE